MSGYGAKHMVAILEYLGLPVLEGKDLEVALEEFPAAFQKRLLALGPPPHNQGNRATALVGTALDIFAESIPKKSPTYSGIEELASISRRTEFNRRREQKPINLKILDEIVRDPKYLSALKVRTQS